jgi:hypothetical protein
LPIGVAGDALAHHAEEPGVMALENMKACISC